MDRSQVFSIPGADFYFKKPASSYQTLKPTTRSGISFGNHLQNAQVHFGTESFHVTLLTRYRH
jgi:hypothetical protein